MLNTGTHVQIDLTKKAPSREKYREVGEERKKERIFNETDLWRRGIIREGSSDKLRKEKERLASVVSTTVN